MGDDFVRGIGIDLKGLAESAHRREGVAGTHLAGHDGLLSGIRGLLVKRDAGLKDQAERDHKCIITDSTVKCKEKFGRASWLAGLRRVEMSLDAADMSVRATVRGGQMK